MKTVSLHTRLLLAALVPVTFFVILFSVLVVLFRFQDIADLQNRNAELLVEKYRLALLASPDPASWERLTRQALEDSDIRTICIRNSEGTSVVETAPRLSRDIPVLLPGSRPKPVDTGEGTIYFREVGTLTPGGSTYWIILELRQAPFLIARYQSVINISITAFALLFVLSLVLTSAIRRWLEPIAIMSQQILRLTHDDLEKRLDTRAEGDLAQLQDDINALLDHVARSVAELRQDIEQTRADLEENYQTIEAQNIELRLSRAQAIEGNRVKSAFLANISHELRTPLNSINGFSRLLLKTPLQDKQRDFVETIRNSAGNLLSIINDVLDFSKIEAGKLQLESQPFSIEDAVYDVLNMMSPQADDKGLEQLAFIYEDVPPLMSGDALRLKQVLTNLVSNAIKFTARGEIIVRVMLEDPHPPTHNLIKISVSDTGIGLSKTAKADLFQAFQQGDPSVSRQFGGTGLGLVIAKNLVELMEGEIGFDQEQEKGSTFWFTFRSGIVDNPAETDAPPLESVRVLLLEPMDKARQLLRATLLRAGSECLAVNDWRELLERSREPCDTIIVSGNAIDRNAAGYLTALREHYAGKIIILTHGLDSHLESRHLEAFRLVTVSSPVRPRHLIGLIAESRTSTGVSDNKTDSRPQESRISVLAVDDNPANLKLVCTLLEDMGIRATAATSGMEAIAVAARQRFDLIFMDIQMPGMSGIDATRQIRAQESESQRVPIIALTAHALADEREQMLQEGMNDYLTKPLQEEQLAHIIQRWTGILIEEHPVNPANTEVKTDAVAGTGLVDWQESLSLAAGKPELARDMLRMLRDGIPAMEEKIREHIEAGNHTALLAQIHYLHGATRYCGVPMLRQTANQLETRLKQLLKAETPAREALEILEPELRFLGYLLQEIRKTPLPWELPAQESGLS